MHEVRHSHASPSPSFIKPAPNVRVLLHVRVRVHNVHSLGGTEGDVIDKRRTTLGLFERGCLLSGLNLTTH